MSIVVTPEWPYCSYPLLVEVYALCNFGCLYCFTRHKETWHNKAFKRRKRGFDPRKDMLDVSVFVNCFDNLAPRTRMERILRSFLKKRLAFQIGGQTEPAGKLELKFKQTKRLLEILKDKGNKYPVRISIKGTAFERDEYLRIFEGYDTATVLVSIISLNERVLSAIEPNVPTVTERLRMAKTLSKTGVNLGLRLRPIIPGFTEKTLDELFHKAREVGFQWVTVEWLRIPRTMTNVTKRNYKKLSTAIGFDLVDYYAKHGDVKMNRNGCVRLKKEATADLYDEILHLGRKYELPVASCNSDYRCIETMTPNCCGVSLCDPYWSRMQFSYAVYLAKLNGKVTLDDILDRKSPLFAISNRDNYPKDYCGLSYGESLMRIWNNPEHRYYPATFFRELRYVGKDKNGNHTFAYDLY
jgi:DNA repair photolyase